jgi:hypothetical protein
MLPEIKTASSSQQISVDNTWQEQGITTVTVINRSVFGVNNALV